MDTLVFDIETQNFFTDPDVGWDNFAALKISVVGVYSYAQDRYFCYEEGQLERLSDLFRGAARLAGFSMNRYDVPVLQCHFGRLKSARDINLWQRDRVDLLEEIEIATGNRISLSKLAQANLGVGKEQNGAEAIGLWQRGEIEALKEYCLKDVRLTKELYDLFRRDGALIVPDRATGEPVRVTFHSALKAQAQLL